MWLLDTKGSHFYQIALVMLICCSDSSLPEERKPGNCTSTKIKTSSNTTNQRNANCSNETKSTNGSKINKSGLHDEYYMMLGPNMAVTLLGMICNFLLILLITIDPLNILRRGAWFTILNLSIADFLACLDHFVKSYHFYIRDLKTLFKMNSELEFFWMLSVGASFMLLTFLTLQVYSIIKYPMKSRYIVTRHKVALSCLFIWVLAIGLGFSEISYLWTDKSLYIYIGGIAVLELATIIQVLLKILIIYEILGSGCEGMCSETQNERQKDIAKTVMMLNVILIVTAFPYFVAKQIELGERVVGTETSSFLRKFPYLYEPVALLNFVANPILYSLRLQDYRQSLIALFTFKCKYRHRSQSISSQRTLASKPSISLQEKRTSTETTKV
ncbi:succinate receptor 1-like [Dendronephthya gigantea]|uniref:succinate receptor 1-like n=1 Tax=Dendronephthya gigantea TaxID=151771 RepID=UPI00106A0E14|nr:succinate receptor 1-like [Dendronephthya gigantea]